MAGFWPTMIRQALVARLVWRLMRFFTIAAAIVKHDPLELRE